jgi:hypothetical protein
MKLKLFLVSMAIACLLIPHYAGAATVLDETDSIMGASWVTYSFTTDQTSSDYEVTLTDFGFPAAFEFLGVAITTSNVLAAMLLEPDTKTFSLDPETTYLASVFGIAAEPLGTGLFNINVTAIPIPPSLILLGTSVFGLILLRRRVR